MNAAYIHLALNNFPPILSLAGVFLLIGAMAARSDGVRKAGLVVLLFAAVTSVPAFLAGKKAEEIVKPLQGVDVQAIHPHEDAATSGFILLLVTGAVALVALFVQPRRVLTIVVLLLAIASSINLFYAAKLGGKIHHPEAQMRHG